MAATRKMSYAPKMSTSTILDQMLEPVTAVMSREFAETLVKLKADAILLNRIEELRTKANNGTMTTEEDTEYKDFVEAVDPISILQAKGEEGPSTGDLGWTHRGVTPFANVQMDLANIATCRNWPRHLFHSTSNILLRSSITSITR